MSKTKKRVSKKINNMDIAAKVAVESKSEDAFYTEIGNYLLNDKKVHDVQFIVGEQKEEITAVKLLLINQSRTWWSMLSQDSPLAETKPIHLPDIDPEVFILLLKHSYGGLEKLDDLSDDMVEKLCYCANKYLMKSLMAKIAIRLEPKGVEGLFPALHCLVYYNLHSVEDSVKKIVQTQTKKLFEHPEFLNCDVDSITYICKQDKLNCDELTLWKSVVSWAKHKTQECEGTQLRQWMSQPLQHLRLLTLGQQALCDHVFSLGLLDGNEIASLCKQDVTGISTLCDSKSFRNCNSSNRNGQWPQVSVYDEDDYDEYSKPRIIRTRINRIPVHPDHC